MFSTLTSIGTERLVAAALVAIGYCAFAIWCLRRPSKHVTAVDGVQADSEPHTLVAYSSQTGFAEQLALQTAKSLTNARITALADVASTELPLVKQALFVVSTTGEGDAPDSAARFVRDALSQSMPLENLRYGVLALGDREYHNFCAFGHRLDAWLRHQGATPLFDVVEVDNGDEGALRHWQHQLSVLSGRTDLPDWETARYERWKLVERTLVNPGSAGDPCYHIVLQPEPGSAAHWQAGDIAEVDPRNSTWDANGAPLPHREYSIASIPADGAIHLLIRRMARPGGEPGIGSGWLTHQAEPGSPIAMRIRTNTNFRLPADARPLILIGNGTGIAGLRSLLKERVANGHPRNWLIFGERNAAHDRLYSTDLERWTAERALETDLVFSRDQPERRYVQHRLLERAEKLHDWVAAGASIYVCGSLKGMAPAVDATLAHLLGADLLEQLTLDGRYRRDVY